jgi:predicted DNA-binding protein (MmcQ/YjbR family)
VALALPNTTEQPHFERTSFRVKKKIFLTIDPEGLFAVVKLTEAEQDIFKIASKGTVLPVDNKWGKQGWTKVDLKNVDRELFFEVLNASYQNVIGTLTK